MISSPRWQCASTEARFAMVPLGTKTSRLLAQQAGHSLLQPVYGWVVAPAVVSQLGLGHSPAHGG